MKIKVEIQEKIYEVTIHDIHARPVIAEVDGVKYQVWPEEATQTASIPETPAPQAPAVATPRGSRTKTPRARSCRSRRARHR